MRLFSRRKSSTQSFGDQSTPHPQSYHENGRQSHPVPSQESSYFDSAAPPPAAVPLNDRTMNTNNSLARNPSISHRFTKSSRPITAQSEYSFRPTLTPKQTKKNERPISAASRVFFNNGHPITPSGKNPRRRENTQSQPNLPKDISATPLRSAASVRSLKVKSLDLLKSNPRLKYLTPPLPPPSRSAPPTQLQFKHDGRGLFASKTVANLADELDTHGLRKLLERDSRRYGRYRSSEDVRRQYESMPEQIPRSRGNTTNERNMDYDSIGYPIQREYDQREYNPFADPGPSTIRPVVGSDRTDSFHSISHRRQDSGHSRHEEQPQPQPQPRGRRTKPDLPPILLFGQGQQSRPNESSSPRESPVVLLGPNSARSTETQSTLPRSQTVTPIQLFSTHTYPPQKPPPSTRPPILSIATDTGTDTASSIRDHEYETADDEFGSETPNALSELDNEEWHDSPVIPRDAKDSTPRPMQRHFNGVERSSPWLADPTTTEDGISESSSAIDFGESEDGVSLSDPIFPPDAQWGGESPVIGSVTPVIGTTVAPVTGTTIPAASPIIHDTAIPAIDVVPPSRGSVESEGSWLSGKMDIEKAVRKSFHASSPSRRVTPILLESSPVTGTLAPSPLKSDALANAYRPDYEGEDYGDSDEDGGVLGQQFEKVRQGSAARRVEVVDGDRVEGIAARISGESPERKRVGTQG